MNITQISDTHFGTERYDAEKALIECLEENPPDVILLTGDVTQRARRSQFDLANQFFTRLPPHNLVAIPGNHDIPLFNIWHRLHSPYKEFLRIFKHIEATLVTDECAIIAINTTCPTRHKDGAISSDTITQVIEQLENSRHSRIRIVAAHHPTAVVLASDKVNLVENAEAAVTAWSAAGMDLMLGGHIHYPFMAPLSGYYPHIARSSWVMQAGTAVSRRVRNEKPNSFNRIVVGKERETARIEQWNYDDRTGKFAVVEAFTPWEESGGFSGETA